MNRKALVGLLSLFLLIGGATAWELTGSIETNFGDYFEDSVGPSNWACNEISAYFIDECTKPIDIELGGSTTSEVKWSIANSASVATDNREQILGSTEKRLNSSYGVAMAEAKAEGIEDLNDGASEAKSTSNASDIVRSWYSEIQRNAINYRNRHALKLNSSLNEAEKASLGGVWKLPSGRYNSKSHDSYTSSNIRLVPYNHTLYSGENFTAYHVEANLKGYDCDASSDIRKWVRLTSQRTFHGDLLRPGCSADYSFDTDIKFNGPNSTVMYMNPVKYLDAFDSIASKKDQAISNVQTVVSDIYAKYSAGEVNVSSSLGPLEVLKTSSTSFDSTGFYDYATVTARQMGLNTDDTYAFKVEWSQEGSNETQSDVGQLFLDDGDFNDTIEVGTEYNVTDETVWFTHTASNGEPVQTVLNGTFNVTEMTDKSSGETISSTSTQDISVYESNVTDLQNQLEELRELYEEAQTDSSGGTSGGGSWSPYQLGLGASLFLILALLLVIGGAILA